jgi:hypothetical protein
MASITSVQPFTAMIGPVSATGVLFVTAPLADSFAHGALTVDGFVQASFAVLIYGAPVCVKVLDAIVCIKFDVVTATLVGAVSKSDEKQLEASTSWHRLIDFV